MHKTKGKLMKLLMKKLIDVLRKFKCHFGIILSMLFLFLARPCNYVHHVATNKKDFCLVVV